ncbi:hypothetical protein OGAPHI_001757 [Ogataea philodendri]|uniref:Uncharacterized protein n=1 Tax=Ogataea philodendri TaxID=1378263 RepID=A0A9P8P939_9ASCO|nr:uncharacterized protein OGAPHI_001757 [Ogataea philodendri]KAH3668003.1 hypothetical protein OGAPHI_001757 [Ogataea philodendri]
MMRTFGNLSIKFCFLAVWSPYEISSTIENFSKAVYRSWVSLLLISNWTCMNGSNVMDDFLLFGSCRIERKFPPNSSTTGDGLMSTCLFTASFWFAPTSIHPLSSLCDVPFTWPILIISRAELIDFKIEGSVIEVCRSVTSLSVKREMLSRNSSCRPSNK